MSITALSPQILTIYVPTNSKDVYGATDRTYATSFSTIGRINYLDGVEFLLDGKFATIPTHKIFIDGVLTINESFIIGDNDGNKYDIIHVYNIGEYAGLHHLEILCKKINEHNITFI